MRRSSDKVFHLMVTALAAVLTAIAGITMWSEHDPGRLRQWLAHWPQPAWLNGWRHATDEREVPVKRTSTSPSVSPQASARPSTTTAPSRPPNDEDELRIIARGVSAETVRHVRQLLTEHAVLSLVSGVVQAHLREPVYLYLAQSASDYKAVLSSLGVSPEEASRFTRDTGGFTEGSTIIVPMYQNGDEADLINTLAHELTHVYLNQNMGALPSWIDEGLAVYVGMSAQRSDESRVAYDGYAKRAAESVVEAARNGKLVPLTADESQVLQGGQSYDLELQDWIAVAELLHTRGASALHRYLALVSEGAPAATAFQKAFGLTEQSFNHEMTQLLQQAAGAPDQGVRLFFSIPPSYHGHLQILQHGSHIWRGLAAPAGNWQVTVLPSGDVSGDLRVTTTTNDTTPPDQHTLYVDLDPDQPLTYQGQKVEDCGFAIDVHDGVYGFVNAWITLSNGKSEYLDDPVLFGVALTNVKDLSMNHSLEWLWSSHG